MSWTDEKVSKLKELWGKGNTASQIAEILGGVSRNAVIGKAHRLNLSGKIVPKQLEELDENSCKWPIGHPNEENFYFCGRTSLKDFSYCKLHLLYAFQPKNKKEDVVEKDSEVPKFIQKKIRSA